MITFFQTSSWWYFNLSGDSGNMNKTIVKIMGTINWVFTWSKQFRWFPKKNAMIIPKLYDGSYNEFKAPRTLNLIKSNRYHMSAILSHTNIFLSETIDFTYRLIYHLRMMEFQQLVRHRQFLREFSLHTNNKHFAPKSKVVNLAKIVKKNLGFNCWIFFHINAHNWRQTKQMNRSFYTKQLAQWQNSEVTCHRNVVNLFHFINKFRFLIFFIYQWNRQHSPATQLAMPHPKSMDPLQMYCSHFAAQENLSSPTHSMNQTIMWVDYLF